MYEYDSQLRTPVLDRADHAVQTEISTASEMSCDNIDNRLSMCMSAYVHMNVCVQEEHLNEKEMGKVIRMHACICIHSTVITTV